MIKEKLFIQKLKEILIANKIEFIEKENKDIAIEFIYKNKNIIINTLGQLYTETEEPEDIQYIEMLIAKAQKLADVSVEKPIIENGELETIRIENTNYKLIMQLKNHLLLYKFKGVYGYEYIICDKTIKNKEIIYTKINKVENIKMAQVLINQRAKLIFKNEKLYSNKELEEVIYVLHDVKIEPKRKPYIMEFINKSMTILQNN